MESVPNGQQPATHSHAWACTAIRTVLIAGTLAALATTSLIQTNGRASAQQLAAPPARAALVVPLPGPWSLPDIGPFAFGHLEFDWNPSAPGGVPGFNSWPPGSRP